MMSFGLSYKSAKVLFETLQKADHRIKTGFGVSEVMYGDDSTPHMGLGQGNRHAPTTWGLISSKMMQVMRMRRHGVTLTLTLSKELLSMVCFAFVDNTDLPVTSDDPDATAKDLIALFQLALDLWARCLGTTGGELHPIKLFAHIINYKWNGTDWQYRDVEEVVAQFTLLDWHGR